MATWASSDFFLGEDKNFQGGGASIYFLTKKQLKRYYFSQKSLKTYYFWPAKAGQGEGGKSHPCHPLGTPMDDNDILLHKYFIGNNG
jgi:hypothetical protein